MIAIIDYGAGNLRSVINAITRIGYQANITNRPEDILSAKAVFFPGVGAAGDTMASLRSLGLTDTIHQTGGRKSDHYSVSASDSRSCLPVLKKAAGMNV